MITTSPEITGATHRRTSRRILDLFRRSATRFETLNGQVDFRQREAGEVQIELEIKFLDFKEAFSQQPFIPMRILGQLVVGNPERFYLRRGQMVQLDDRHLGHFQPLGGEKATMTHDDMTLIVYHDRYNKTELPNTVGDLVDLLLGVLPRIPRIEDQFLQVSILNVYFD
jgi:hypothetical protein